MKKMRVAQVPGPKQPFQIVERPVPEPGPGEVRVKVAACGICHSDMYTADGLWPGIEYPRAPGHEVAGVVDALGAGVTTFNSLRNAGVRPPDLVALIGGRRFVRGWPSGTSIDSQDTLAFSALNGVRPMTEEYPQQRAAEGYARMMSGDARFRVVLTMGNS